MKSTPIEYQWFQGLNALRFIAAALVVLMHTHLGMKQAGLAVLPEFPILLKGFSAVSFFFVLSGFLITYLLLKEKKQTQTVNVAQFYWRRVFRIWPLYFAVIAFGFLFYWEIVPAAKLDFEVHYSKTWAIVLYGFFAANLMNSLYHVGGILHITWSIAVEEQFYLFWAPLMKKVRNQIPLLIATITLTSYTLFILNAFNAFQLSEEWQLFLQTLQFHYMGIGAAAAYLLYHHHNRLLNLKVFTHQGLQLIMMLGLMAYYFFYEKNFWAEILLPIPLALLYCWLILNVSINPHKIIRLENKATHFLGNISFGIYMLHMPLVYAVSFLMRFCSFEFQGTTSYFILFYGAVFASTVTLAFISNRFFEAPINHWGKKWMKRPSKTNTKELVEQAQLKLFKINLSSKN